MNARQRVIAELKRAYDDGRVNAMNVFRGYHYATGENGWHWQDFGRAEIHHAGKSVEEVKKYVNEVLACRQ